MLLRVGGAVLCCAVLAACAAQGRVRSLSDSAAESVRGEKALVPALAPDSVPRGLFSDTSLVEDPDANGLRYIRGLIVIHFKRNATPNQRTEAVGLIGGQVVGGFRVAGSDGYYLVRVVRDTSRHSAKGALKKLRTLPQIEEASLEHVLPSMRATRSGGEVPALPPDSTPWSHFTNSSNWITNPAYFSGTIIRDVLEVHFRMGVSQTVRQEAIAAVGGTVIGGAKLYNDGDGWYYVLVPIAKTTLLAAKQSLESNADVELVSFVMVGGVR